MKVQVAQSIHELEPDRWDAVAGSRLSLRHEWLRLLEAGALGYQALYLLVEDEQGPLAAAVSPAWAVEWWERLAFRQLLALYPPYSASTSGLALREGCSLEALFPRLEPLLRQVAREHRRWVLSLTVNTTADADYLQRQGFRALALAPNAVLPIAWPSYEAYLASFPSRIRNEFRRSRKRAESAGARIQAAAPIPGHERELHALLVKTFTLHGSKTLPPFKERFFSEAAALQSGRAVLFTGHLGDELVGYLLTYNDGRSLFTPLAGLDEKARDAYVYFVLLEEVVRWAIEQGLSRVHLGTTNYRVKQRMGCQLQPRVACYRASSRLFAPLVARAAPLLERSWGYRAPADEEPEGSGAEGSGTPSSRE